MKKDFRLYLISFLLVAFFAILPPLVSALILVPFSLSIDLMYLAYYYFIFYLLLFILLLMLFLGWKKNKINNRLFFLIYGVLLFLITVYISGSWAGSMVGKVVHAPFGF